ncbi:MAG TPA: D-alanine--D-alanine ligase [Thermoanaerobaculia bacterium]|nr:D-alanine--D-alanine ligase [Thermoanaerobaculia bacterium]
MRILILHNEVGAEASALERDVLDQAAAVAGALRRLGHDSDALACTLDLAQIDRELASRGPDLVFNLVESLGGADRLIHVVPALLEARGIAFTGSSSSTLLRSSDKARAKEELASAGVPVLPTVARWPGRAGGSVPPDERWIVKSVWEHGSRGLADDAILGPGTRVREAMAQLSERLGGELLAEPFVDGRELNLSLLAAEGEGGFEGDVDVLPPAEIDFVGYPAGKPRIVGYSAKWEEASFEALHTPRRFDFPPGDQPLLDLLCEIARRCWATLGLRGWARVDFRVDDAGRPWVLEVNANPCLAPDAGFRAALERAGVDFDRAIWRICADAIGGDARSRDVALASPRSARGC